MSTLSINMFRFITAWKAALGSEYRGWKITREDGERVLYIVNRNGHVSTSVSIDTGDTFYHPYSNYFVGA